MGAKTRGSSGVDKKTQINNRPDEILSYYLGPPHDEGARLLWDCRECRKHHKFALNKESQRAGCFNAACGGHGLKDSIGLIAHFEGLDTRDDFVALLQRGEEILGLGMKAGRSRKPSSTNPPNDAQHPTADDQVATGKTSNNQRNYQSSDARKAEEALDRLQLCHQVYSRILELSPLEDRDKRFWRMRGISYATIEKGRFGSMSIERAAYIKERLCKEFGRQELVRYVPGFSENPETKKLVFTLTGDYTLIPYHDQTGNVTTIEGRAIGEPLEGMGKYISLRGSGNHLYVFPGLEASALEAITEGSIGAIVAADNGIAIGAIQGCERYKASSSKSAPDGEPGGPLLEMAGVKWGGKVVPYIPDSDDPPNAQVMAAAPKAARHLARSGGGAPAIARLPNGVDLDEWLLSISKPERRFAFTQLLSQAADPGVYETLHANHEEGLQGDRQPSGTIVESQTAQDLPVEPSTLAENGHSSGSERRPAKPRSTRASAKQDCKQWAAGPATRAGDSALSLARGPYTVALPDLIAPDSHTVEVSSTTEQPEPSDAVEVDETSGADASRELADQVYRRILELCPPLEAHLDALENIGVMREAAAAGNFGSVDHDRCLGLARTLGKEMAPNQLPEIPGFDRTGAGAIRFSLSGDYLLLPCYDSDGFLRGVEGLPYDPDSETIEPEETVQLSGAGSHLYVFAPYHPAALEGFCEGVLGALLAAQDDVVLGAIGSFRRYKASSGAGARAQPPNAVLPELEGVDFLGMEIPYAPRSAIAESNARAHETAPAVRWLIEKQNGVPKLAPLPSIYTDEEGYNEEDEEHEAQEEEQEEEQDEGRGGGYEEAQPGESVDESASISDAPEASAPPKVTEVDSLGKWILTLPEEESAESLREIFPELPAFTTSPESAQEREGRPLVEASERPRLLGLRAAYVALAISAVVAAIVSSLISAAWKFSSYTTATPSGEVIAPGGLLSTVQSITGSLPFEILYLLRGPLAILAGLLVGFRLVRCLTGGAVSHSASHRTSNEAQYTQRADEVGEGRMVDAGAGKSRDRWRRHLLPSPGPATRSAVRRGQVLAAGLAWIVAFAVAWPGLILAAIIYSFSVKVDPGPAGIVFDYPMLAAAAVAIGAALYVVSKRADIARKEVQLLSGYLPKETRKRSWLGKLFRSSHH